MGNTGFNKRLNNTGSGLPIFGGSEGGIRLRYGWSDNSFRMWVTLRRQGIISAEIERIIGERGEFTDEDFFFTEAELAGVDSVSLKFLIRIPDDDTRGLFIESISTIVPEPDPGLVLGRALAGAAVARGLKKKSQK